MMNLCCTEIFHDNLAIRCFNHLRSKFPLWCLQSLSLILGYQNMSFLFLLNWSPMTLTIHDDSDPFWSLITFYFFQKRPFCPSPKYMVRFDSLDFRGLTTQLCSTCMKIKQNTIKTDFQTCKLHGFLGVAVYGIFCWKITSSQYTAYILNKETDLTLPVDNKYF